MAFLNGFSSPTFVTVGQGPSSDYNRQSAPNGQRLVAIDGTPVRVVMIAFAAAAALTALKLAGIRFNIGAST